MSERHNVFPMARSGFAFGLEDAPVMLDGMKVLFDEKVGLYPVDLQRDEDVNNGTSDAHGHDGALSRRTGSQGARRHGRPVSRRR